MEAIQDASCTNNFMKRGQEAMGGVHWWLFAVFSKRGTEGERWGQAQARTGWLKSRKEKSEVRVGKFGEWV